MACFAPSSVKIHSFLLPTIKTVEKKKGKGRREEEEEMVDCTRPMIHRSISVEAARALTAYML